MSFPGERAASISLDADYAVASSPKKRAALPKYRYAVRIAAVLVAVLGDILLIAAAALTAAFVRFENLSQANTIDLLLVIVPAFLLAAVALNVYRLNTLRSFFASVGKTLLALTIAAGLTFTIAFALKVGATYSRLETSITFGTAATYLAMGHVLYAACLERLSGAIDPRVLILGPADRTRPIRFYLSEYTDRYGTRTASSSLSMIQVNGRHGLNSFD